MKICQKCGKENKSNYLNICQSCYNKDWFLKNIDRKCFTCGKENKGFGVNCYACSKALREANQKIVPCNGCGRTNVKIVLKSLVLCTTCNRKKREEEIPGYREKRILYNRQSHRKYRGKEPYGPLQRKPAGEGHVTKQGYKIISKVGHPNANSDKGAIPEHIFIMSEYLGRPLKKGETVHHKNGVRHDNRIENLELWNKSHPPGQRVDDKIRHYKEFLIEYGYKIIDP